MSQWLTTACENESYTADYRLENLKVSKTFRFCRSASHFLWRSA